MRPNPELTFPWPDTPAAGTCTQVAEDVYWLRMPLPFSLDHINLWLLADQKQNKNGWTIVDTGFADASTKNLWKKLFSDHMQNLPVTKIIVTHFHPDHIGLAGWLQVKTAAPVSITRTEWLMSSYLYNDTECRHSDVQANFYAENGLEIERVKAMKQRGNSYRDAITAPPTRYQRLQENDRLTINDRSWRVLIGQGHTPEHACLYCEELGVLIAGDQVLPTITPNVTLHAAEPDTNPLKLFLETMEKLQLLPDDTLVLPSHGLPFRGLQQRLRQTREHHVKHFNDILNALDTRKSAADLLAVLFRPNLDTHQISFAMGEALAHLAYLESENKVTANTHQGIRKFQLNK